MTALRGHRSPSVLKQRLRVWLKSHAVVSFAAGLASPVLAAIANSWRVQVIQHPEVTQRLASPNQPVLYAVWHGRMFALLKGLDLTHTALLVSASNDGNFITETVKLLGLTHFIRGSSGHFGARAVRAIHHALHQQGLSVVMTVDGPRGPRFQVNPSIIRMAANLGVPIVPVMASASPLLFWAVNAWDHYMGPRWCARQTIVLGQPLWVTDRNPTPEQVENYRQTLQNRMGQGTCLLDVSHGHHAYWQLGQSQTL
jgi:lysophospholipid acyltransferase (LPLAT)-like uncharacterized protein